MGGAADGEGLAAQLEGGCRGLGVAVPAAVQRALLDYLDELGQWNRSYNLTAVREPARMVTLHLLDSLSVLPFLAGEAVVDVGAGAGLPGLVLALADPHRRYVLLDANGKKAAFMRHAVRRLRPGNVEVVQARVEDYRPSDDGFDCVISRAFASLADMASGCAHLLAPGGYLMAMKGRYPQQEVAALPGAFELRESHRLTIPGLDAERHLLVVQRSAAA